MNSNNNNIDAEPNLPFDDGKSGFDVPFNYFSLFENKLKAKLEFDTELSEFNLLAAINKNNNFVTPINYFKNSEVKLENVSELFLFENLQNIKKVEHNDLKSEYTNYLQTKLVKKIDLIDEVINYNTLYSLEKTNAYLVADNYFENLHSQIKEKIYATSEIKTNTIDAILDFIFGKKMALAFGLFLLIGLSIVLFNASQKTIINADCNTLACLQKQELLKTKTILVLDEEQLIDLVNEKTFDKQINAEIPIDSLQQTIYLLDNSNTEQLLDEL